MALYKKFQFVKFRRSPAFIIFIDGEGIPEVEAYNCVLFRPHLIDERIKVDYSHFGTRSEEVILKDIFEDELKPLKKVTFEIADRAKTFVTLVHDERPDLITNLDYLEALTQIEAHINEQKVVKNGSL